MNLWDSQIQYILGSISYRYKFLLLSNMEHQFQDSGLSRFPLFTCM